MKNKLLPLLFVLGSYSAYSQVVIGKQEVTPSAQLEVYANDKGILIPRVELTGSTDTTTIKSGNVNSLLVFNTKTISDVKAGYYYWSETDKKWIKLAVSGETTGNSSVVIGTGIPGEKGQAGYPGEGVNLYTDSLTGIVYVQNANGTWSSLNGKNGIDGKDGIAGDHGLPGTKGLDGTIQMYIDYDSGIVYVKDPKDATKWVPLNGPSGNNGKDGIAGGTGAPGTTGAAGITKDSTIYVDNSTGTVYILVPGTDPLDPKNWIPLNGEAGNNGKDGMTGGTGAPGTPGAAGISKDSTIYVDNSTGTVYILTPGADPLDPASWISINGKDGLDGKNGIMGDHGLPGTKGLDGTIQMYIDYDSGIVYVKDPADATKWVPLNGPTGNNGKDGMIGGTGAPGTPGAAGISKDSTIYVDNTTGTVYILVPGTDPLDPKNWIPLNGEAGNNGKDGMTGGTGAPGTPGAAGISKDSTIYVDNTTGTVYILKPGADPLDPTSWISINGKDGLDGKNGIAGGKGLPGDAGLDGTVEMYIDYNTGIVYVKDPADATKWVSLNGPTGNNGKDGMIGGTGAPGTPGAAGISKDSTIYVDNTTGTVYILVPGTDPLDPKNWIPLNGEAGNNGKDGMTGGTGAPGTPGAAGISKDSTIYVDNTTGTVYILKPGADPLDPTSWISINGKDGLDGKNGIAGGKGLPGDAGLDGTVEMYIDYNTGIVYVKDPADATKWVPLNGPTGNNGKDGMIGGTGAPGTPGAAGISKDSTIYVDNTTGTVYILVPGTDPLDPKNWIPLNGEAGNNGKDGMTGGTGAPGTPGAAGISKDSTIYVDNTTGTVYILTPGADPLDPTSWISINGKDGLDGKNGIAGGKGLPGDAGLDGTVEMYIDYNTGIVYVKDPADATKWVPLNGPTGNNGKDGMIGGTGAPGTPGAAGISKDSTIYVDNTTGTVYILVPGTDPLDPKNWIPLNGEAGNNGKDGMTGGTGAPGTPGAAGISKDSTIYVDNTTGTVYILTPGADPLDPTSWISINGKDGLDGKNGIAGGKGLPGDAGLDGTVEMYIDYNTGIVYVKDPADATKWVKVSGRDGVDGAAGLAGGPGIPGKDGVTAPANTTTWIDTTTGIVYILDPVSKEWVKVSGNDGKDGKSFTYADFTQEELDGLKGAKGDTGASFTFNDFTSEELAGLKGAKGDTGAALTFSDLTEEEKDGLKGAKGDTGAAFTYADFTSEELAGLKGAKGDTGASLTFADLTEEEIDGLKGAKGDTGAAFTYENFTEEQLAGLKGPQGDSGAQGLAGAKGDTGADGTTSFVPAVTTGHDIATYTDASGNPAAIKETITSLKDVVTKTTDERGQEFDVHTLTYTDEAGAESAVDMSTLVKGVETLTSLEYDGSKGELSYQDEKGDTTSFSLVDLVGENETLTKLEVDSDTGKLVYTDEKKVANSLDIADLVKEPWYSAATNKGATLNTENVYTQGWVGIGFTTPSDAPNEKLRVNGAITTVNSYYADYVFEDYFKGFSNIKADYKFKTLAEIDAYIKKNNHLPGITPINELMKTKEGYSFNVSELSIQLLEKTEELYLHVIEQDKELEAKNNEIQQLKAESEAMKAASEVMNARLEKLEKLMSVK